MRLQADRRDPRRSVVFLACVLCAASVYAQPMGTSIPGPGTGQPSAPVPRGSVGLDAAATASRANAAAKCKTLSGDEKAACLQQARQAPESPETSRETRGSVDRAGPGSTGMSSGASR
jgi:hypothetical protein